MADFRRLLYVFAVVAFLASLTVPAYAQFTCNNFNAVNVPARAEGYTELVGDITFNCSANGQPSTTPGSVVPSVNISVSSNTNITSRILAINASRLVNFNEALLIIDEPNTTKWPLGRPIANCGANGEDSGADGPGVCHIVAPALPINTYDGAVGIMANSSGVDVPCPTLTTFGCGRPNVFQGRNAASLISGQFNAIQFLEVPFDPPGTAGNRSIRITNIRVDATRFGVSSPFSTVPVTATVSFGGGTTISVPDTTVTVAQVQQGMSVRIDSASGFLQCIGTDQEGSNDKNNPFFVGVNGAPPSFHTGGGMNIRVLENFGTAWKVKNIAGTLANGTFSTTNNLITYNGGTAAPSTAGDNAQNVPGAVYNTESGFEYNSGTVVPSPNPPPGLGVGTVPTIPGGNHPLFNATTNIQAAGIATQGTRIAVQVSTPLPNGITGLFFPIVVPIRNQANGVQTGVMVADALVDQNGFGAPFLAPAATVFSFTPSGGGTPATVPNSSTTPANSNFVQVNPLAPVITYEVLFSQPGALEYADITPAVVFNNNSLSTNLAQTGVTVTATVSFAPIASGLANPNRPQLDGFYATPRFTSSFKTPADALFTIQKCACDLLFPWVVSAGSIDTGIVIANTSLDPCGGNSSCTLPFAGPNQAVPQVGAVTFYYFGTVGIGDHNAVANLAPNVSLPVSAGGYVAHVLSQNTTATNGLGSRTNFAGYVIAQADFQYCHGVVDITGAGGSVIFNYVGLQLDGSRLVRTNQIGENLGH